MKSGSELPMLKLLVPYIFGTGLLILFPWPAKYTGVLLICFALISLLLYVFNKRRHTPFLNTLSIFLLFMSLGGYLTSLKFSELNNSPLKNNNQGTYLIKINENPQEKEKTLKAEALVIGKIERDQKLHEINETVLLYFNKPMLPLKTGTFIYVYCSFRQIEDPENKYQFNYKEYMSRKGIHHVAFIKSANSYFKTPLVEINIIRNLTEYATQNLKDLIKNNMKNKEAIAVTESLLFGYKNDVSRDLVNAYSRTGTLHVLAVSGMHVAIVFLLFAKALWFMERFKYGVVLRFIVIMAGIWSYCLLTGMAPSILRAGLMISLILFGKALNRHTNVYNLIAFSAFIILLINPFDLLDIGFQLSYAAVIGIIYLQPKIQNIYAPSNRILREIWSILNISFCAQIATFPLSLFYFHQFPNYFLITNLLIIPLTTMVIYAGICMVVFSKFTPVLTFFSWITENLVLLTNRLVKWFETLPFSYTDGIKISSFQLIVIYIIICCLLFWFLYCSKTSFWLGLFGLFVYCCSDSYDKIRLQKQNNIVIFNIPKYNAILLSDGRSSLLITDAIPEHTKWFYIKGWLVEKRLWPVNHQIDFKDIIHNKHYLFKNMGLSIDQGVIFFKSFRLNLNQKIALDKKVECTYLLPDYYDNKSNRSDYMSRNVIIGQGKSKRLQKKLIIFLSKYHNNVNKYKPTKTPINLIINY